MSSIKGVEINNNIIVDLNDKSYQLNPIFKSVTGSRLYGTQYEKGENPLDPDYVSDYDYRGLFSVNTEAFISLTLPQFDTIQIANEEDMEYYELRKFILLSLKNNPNIMDILFAPKEAILLQSSEMKDILDNRKEFLSIKAEGSFSGYAMSQLVRMKNHKKYVTEYHDISNVEHVLKDAFDKKLIDFLFISDHFNGKLAERITNEKANKNTVLQETISLADLEKMYNLNLKRYTKQPIYEFMSFYDNEFNKVSAKERETILNIIKTQGNYVSISNSILKLTDGGNGIFHRAGTLINNTVKNQGNFLCMSTIDHNNYTSKLDHINDLWEWRLGRNPKRAILEDKYGYDTKHAMHLVRLLSGAEDLILKADYSPRLYGANLSLIKNIREGKMTYDEVLKLAETKFKSLKTMVKSSNCKLPEEPNYGLINELMLNLYKSNDFFIKPLKKQENKDILQKKSVLLKK